MIALKKKAIINGSMLLFMLALTIVVAGAMYSALSSNKEYKNKLARETRDIEGRIQRSKQENLKIVDALELWNGLSVEERSFEGLRLSDAKTVLDEMIETYWLSDVRTTFSKPLITEHTAYKDYNIASSSVSISFNGVSDVMIFSFLDALNEDFPGVITLKKFSIDAKKDMERETIKQIAAGEKPVLFAAGIEFEWRDIKK